MDRIIHSCRPNLREGYAVLERCLQDGDVADDEDSLWNETAKEVNQLHEDAGQAYRRLLAVRRGSIRNCLPTGVDASIVNARVVDSKTAPERQFEHFKDLCDRHVSLLNAHAPNGSDPRGAAAIAELREALDAIVVPQLIVIDTIGQSRLPTELLQSSDGPDASPVGVRLPSPQAPLSSENPFHSPVRTESRRQGWPKIGAVLAGVAVGSMVTLGGAVAGIIFLPWQYSPFVVYPAPFGGLLSGVHVAASIARRYTLDSQFHSEQNLTSSRGFPVLRAGACGALTASMGGAMLGLLFGLNPATMPALALGATLGGGGAAAFLRYFQAQVA